MSNLTKTPTPVQTAVPPRPAADPKHVDVKAAGKSPAWLGKLPTLLLLVVAFGAGWYFASGAGGPEKETLPPETALAKRDADAVMVTVEPVTFRAVQRTVEGVGTIHGFEEVSISARVEGRVRGIHFDVADRVRPGALLMEIDPTDLELSVQQAEKALDVEFAKLGLTGLPDKNVDLEKVPSVMQAQTRMETAQSRHDRVRRLAAIRAISGEETENAAGDFRVAQAELAHQLLMAKTALATIHLKKAALDVSRQQLRDTKLFVPTPTLPVPGTNGDLTYAVTSRSISEGSLVRVGTEVCKLVINQTLKLRLPIPERFSSEVALGQKAEVSTSAFPRPFDGTVTRINPAVDPTTRTFEVEVLIFNPRGELKPGGFAKAAILTRLEKDAATVPLSSLVSFAGINKIFVTENGKAKEVRITQGVQTTGWVEITSPTLPRGAQVITSGQTVLSQDTPVVVRAAEKGANP